MTMIHKVRGVIAIFAITFLLIPLLTFSQGTSGGSGGGGTGGGSGGGGTSGGPTLINPLGDKDLATFFNEILDVIIILAIPIIVFFIILAGFTYVTAGGNETKIEKATKMFMWAIIGGVIILGAKVLTDVIEGTVDAFR